jgi:hypothetical protein
MAIDESSRERRHHPRMPVTRPARIWVDEELIVGRTIDMSAYGVFIATAPTAALKVGSSCRIEVVAAAPNPFSVIAEVRHVGERGAGMQSGERLPVSWTDF